MKKVNAMMLYAKAKEAVAAANASIGASCGALAAHLIAKAKAYAPKADAKETAKAAVSALGELVKGDTVAAAAIVRRATSECIAILLVVPTTKLPELSARARTDAAQAARVKLDLAKPRTAKADAPKADAPKADAPKADAPKADAPKADAPTGSPSQEVDALAKLCAEVTRILSTGTPYEREAIAVAVAKGGFTLGMAKTEGKGAPKADAPKADAPKAKAKAKADAPKAKAKAKRGEARA